MSRGASDHDAHKVKEYSLCGLLHKSLANICLKPHLSNLVVAFFVLGFLATQSNFLSKFLTVHCFME